MEVLRHFNRAMLIFLPVLFLSGSLSAQIESDPLSAIFFLDLGIVIEPVRGGESFSRVVKAPSKEVAFRLKKVESGAVFMASSKEMLTALDRINSRLQNLETSFNQKIEGLRQENASLQKEIALIRTEIPDPLKLPAEKGPNLSRQRKKTKPDVKLKKTELKPAPELSESPEIFHKITPLNFDHSLYMSAVFAYQREDYRSAIDKFSKLELAAAPPRTAENIMYWMADAIQQTGDYKAALKLLHKLISRGELRIDDALIQSGILYRKLGRETLALAAFSAVVTNHPDSDYMRLAQMELKKAEIIQ